MAQLSSRQAKSPRMAAIDNKLIPETPLDFSFLDIEDLNGSCIISNLCLNKIYLIQ